jgi:Polyribonucleotide nucleotidyltransferase (polynucleotide phosphorylase)
MSHRVFIFRCFKQKMNVITKTLQLADGRTITIETGKVAKQTDGAVMLRMNNTVLLATVCAAKDAVPGTDFMPLQVDYREQVFHVDTLLFAFSISVL